MVCFFSFVYATDFYWENPQKISTANTTFPVTVAGNTVGAVFWQEIDNLSTDKGTIWLSAQIKSFSDTESSWQTKERFAGPFSYQGKIPQIFSATINDNDDICVVVLSDTNIISIYTSSDYGKTFTHTRLPQENSQLVAPRVFQSASGGFSIFAVRGTEETFSLYYAQSLDGIIWSDFKIFEPSKNLGNSFLPVLKKISDNSQIVVFQSAYTANNRITYQLYSSVSNDQGKRWSEPFLLTNQSLLSENFLTYTNQRPFLHIFNNKIYMAWERQKVSSGQINVFVAELDTDGKILGTIEQVNSSRSPARQPVLFDYNNILSLLWADTRRGTEQIYLLQKNGILWDDTQLSYGTKSSVFASPLVIPSATKDDLFVFWEQQLSTTQSTIIRLEEDRFVASPQLRALSFSENKRSSAEKMQVSVQMPKDSSGVAGYSWIFTPDKNAEPPKKFMEFPSTKTVSAFAEKDGLWYFKARAKDNAGNWSKPSTLVYYRDTTPPPPPEITPLALDENGFLLHNTFSVSWQEPPIDEPLAGFTYSLSYLAPLSAYYADPQKFNDEYFQTMSKTVPARVLSTGETATWNNRENGVYIFSVAAIDSVGNISKTHSISLLLNKYIPYTTVTTVDTKVDDFGTVFLDIFGKGFTYDGRVTALYIDKDGKAPYDLVLNRPNTDFVVDSNQKISHITFSELEGGTYRIGILHSTRGLYMSQPIITLKEYGTVKKGDYRYQFLPKIQSIITQSRYQIQISTILIVLIMTLTVFGFIFSLHGILKTAQDVFIVRREVQALITGGSMAYAQTKKAGELKNRGMSLKYKMMFFSSSLVLMIILLVSLPLGFIFVKTQKGTLAEGLENRTQVLMESLAAGVKNYMPSQNVLELGFLLNQTNAMPEVDYATILGLPANNRNTHLDVVWASNDPNLSDKIDSKQLVLGTSRYTQSELNDLQSVFDELNQTALNTVGETADTVSQLIAEGIALARKTDSNSIQQRDNIQTVTSQLTQKLTTELNELSAKYSGSIPFFEKKELSVTTGTYLFYKPVLYRQGNDKNYLRAVILLQVSTQDLIQNIRDGRNTVIKITAFIAFLAITLGIIGSLILASVIIQPIRRLARHVAMIRDTEDKEDLADKIIEIKSHDEIGALGETVNAMTVGLVHAAATTKDLIVGKEVQKMFIPLEVDTQGKKLTTGKEENNDVQFFGYYEGAKGVSGDYFDYLKLDDRHYALIKCDVSGKGVPAALIMVEVATLFLNYFKDWSYKKNGYHLSGIVGQINDLIESRGFKGRFAAFTLCLFDFVAGDLYFCNAGDNLIHIYDASEKKKKTITLPETPASGVFPTFMVEMKGGFPVQKLHLDKDDVLFLYTDGIEEAKRLFRDKDYKPIVCAFDNAIEGTAHDFHQVGQESEELSPERVNAIIEAVFHQKTFTLTKSHNGAEEEVLIFDFADCEPSAENAIMALISVEKIFRMYRKPALTEFDRVQVDKKIDEFLQKHFNRYADYCSNKKEHLQSPEYLYYTYSVEDEQYDDLTLVAIKKK